MGGVVLLRRPQRPFRNMAYFGALVTCFVLLLGSPDRSLAGYPESCTDAENSYRNSEFERAIALWLECLTSGELDLGNRAVVSHNLGITYLETGDIVAAIQNLNSALAINPNYGSAYNYLGMAWLKIGN